MDRLIYKSAAEAISGLNSFVIIGGWEQYQDTYQSTLVVRLEPESLQHLAMKTIYKHKAELPWKLLPNKLKCNII